MTAVVAGAMTAGIGAANVLATPPDVAVAQASARDVDLAAYVKIPIIDFDDARPVVDLALPRYRGRYEPTAAWASFRRLGTRTTCPDLNTLVDSNANILAEANGSRADELRRFRLDFGAGGTGGWELLGIVG